MNADFAATVPWVGILGKPKFPTGVTDVGQLTAVGFSRGNLPQWNGKKFVGVSPSSLFNNSSKYGPDNPPYIAYGFLWDPGTLTPFFREEIVVTGATIAEGYQAMVGSPEDLQGCTVASSVGVGGDTLVTLFNTTPYDVTFSRGIWQLIFFK